MNWLYRCPNCRTLLSVPLADRSSRYSCSACTAPHIPPTPAQDHDAYVDTHDWPLEMEQAVVSLRGRLCTVPGCLRIAETLDHRVPWSKGGPTSVKNLWPMCHAHNTDKSDNHYETWLVSLQNSHVLRSSLISALAKRWSS